MAGITISKLTENGLFDNARLAEQKSKEAQEKENSILDDYEDKINKYLSNTSRENVCDHISNIIPEFEPTIAEVRMKGIKVAVPEINVSDSASISGYIYLLNGEVKAFTTDTEYNYENLQSTTSYKIRIVAVDNYAKIKFSKEVEVTTKDVIYLYKEGNEFTELTGGWNVGYTAGTNSAVGSATKESQYIDLKTWGTWCAYGASTVNKIDFTNAKKICIDIYDIAQTKSTGAIKITINSSATTMTVGEETSGTYYVDTTELEGEKTVTISVSNGMDCKLKRVYIEE